MCRNIVKKFAYRSCDVYIKTENKMDALLNTTQNDILNYAIENGIIDISYVQEKIEAMKNEELLRKHPYKIWGGKDGKWYTYLPDEERGRVLKKRNSEDEIKKVVVKYWKEQSENPTVKEVFEEWNDRRLELKKISQATHLRNKQIFNRHYSEFGNTKIKSLDQEKIESFLEEQVPKFNLTAKAFSNLKSITRGFLKRAKKRKLISFNVEEIFDELDMSETDFKISIKEDYEEVFSEEELPIMLEYLTENQDIHNLGILLMFITGMRIGEVVALKYEDFLNDGNAINIKRTETRYKDENDNYTVSIKDFPKTRAGVRQVIIPKDYQWIYKSLRKINTFGEYVFMYHDKRLSTQAIRMRMKRICEKLNIYPKSPHKARKTYGSILLDSNIDNRMIISQMGHTNISCTENHYHRNRKSVETKIDILSSIPEFMAK